MRPHSFRIAIPLLLGWLAQACAGDATSPVDPSLARDKPRTISGEVLGSDGRNVCRTIGSGTMLVQLLNPEFGSTSDVPFLGEQEIRCPQNRYSLAINPGTAFLRLSLPVEGVDLDGLSRRHLDSVDVGEAALSHDVLVQGQALGGSATLDGAPLEGVFLQFLYEFNGNFGATNSTSGPDGSWTEFFGRSPTILQPQVRYSAFTICGSMLGTRLIAGLPSSNFEFPNELSSIDCTLETGAATLFSHTATRMVVTPMPGDIGGGFSPDFFDQYGIGWGAQFPVAVGASPGHDPLVTEIFNGGLVIGVPAQRGKPLRVLSGIDPAGEIECGATCRDLGLNGTVGSTTLGDGRRAVTWSYSDATSAEAAGLEVTQVSIDGRSPGDYVLFRFSIRNRGSAPLTFYAGFFGDLDTEFDAGDDNGFTDLGGKLMYQVSQGETGIHAGTLLLGAPVTGNYFFTPAQFPTPAEQIQALNGGVRQETAGPDDLRYIQGAGPITLKRDQRKDIWIAVVAGETQAQLLANAAAAEAELTQSLSLRLDAAAATTPMATARISGAASRTMNRPVCKHCRPQ